MRQYQLAEIRERIARTGEASHPAERRSPAELGYSGAVTYFMRAGNDSDDIGIASRFFQELKVGRSEIIQEYLVRFLANLDQSPTDIVERNKFYEHFQHSQFTQLANTAEAIVTEKLGAATPSETFDRARNLGLVVIADAMGIIALPATSNEKPQTPDHLRIVS